MRIEHALGAALGHVGMHRHRVRHVDQARRGIAGHHLGAGVIDVLLAVDRDLRPLIREAQGAAAVDRQDVVLAGLDVPHADHGDQPVALLRGEVVGFREILVEVVKLPALGIELGELVVVDRCAEGRPDSVNEVPGHGHTARQPS